MAAKQNPRTKSLGDKYDAFMENTKKRIALITGIFVALTALLTAVIVFGDKVGEFVGTYFQQPPDKYTEYVIDASLQMNTPFSEDVASTKWHSLQSQLQYPVRAALLDTQHVFLRTFGGECGDHAGNSVLRLELGTERRNDPDAAIAELNATLETVRTQLSGGPTLVDAVQKAIEHLERNAKSSDLMSIRIFTGSIDACNIPDADKLILDQMESKGIQPYISIVGMKLVSDDLEALAGVLGGQYLNAQNVDEFNEIITFFNISDQKMLDVAKDRLEQSKQMESVRDEEMAIFYFTELADNSNSSYSRRIQTEACRYLGEIFSNPWLGKLDQAVHYYEKAVTLANDDVARSALIELLPDLIQKESDAELKEKYQEKLATLKNS